MALTKAQVREILSAAGVTSENMSEAVDKIIDGHVTSVNALREDIAKYKADAEKLPIVQKELDDMKANTNDSWKEKYDKLKGEFDKYKGDIEAKETKANKEKAVRAFYESKGITGKNLEIAMRGSRAEIDGIELDGDKIKDASTLDALVKGDFSGLVATTTTKGANTANPPANNGGTKLTKAEIYARDEHGRYKLSTAERQKALAENPELLN